MAPFGSADDVAHGEYFQAFPLACAYKAIDNFVENGERMRRLRKIFRMKRKVKDRCGPNRGLDPFAETLHTGARRYQAALQCAPPCLHLPPSICRARRSTFSPGRLLSREHFPALGRERTAMMRASSARRKTSS